MIALLIERFVLMTDFHHPRHHILTPSLSGAFFVTALGVFLVASVIQYVTIDLLPGMRAVNVLA